jgi:hypothetical protein
VGVSRHVRDRERRDSAEIAVSVLETWQRRGVGKALLHRLADRAQDEGITQFMAMVVAMVCTRPGGVAGTTLQGDSARAALTPLLPTRPSAELERHRRLIESAPQLHAAAVLVLAAFGPTEVGARPELAAIGVAVGAGLRDDRLHGGAVESVAVTSVAVVPDGNRTSLRRVSGSA